MLSISTPGVFFAHVKSSNLKWLSLVKKRDLGWDIAVCFKTDKIYTYQITGEDPEKLYRTVSESPSVGESFNKLIKAKHQMVSILNCGPTIREFLAYVNDNSSPNGSGYGLLLNLIPPASIIGW